MKEIPQELKRLLKEARRLEKGATEHYDPPNYELQGYWAGIQVGMLKTLLTLGYPISKECKK